MHRCEESSFVSRVFSVHDLLRNPPGESDMEGGAIALPAIQDLMMLVAEVTGT